MSHSRYRSPSPEAEIDGYSSEPHTPTARRTDISPTRFTHLPLRAPIPSLFPSPSQSRALSLPPLSSDGLIYSSPVVGTKEQKKAIISRKSQKKRSATMAGKKPAQALEEEHVAADAESKRVTFFNNILNSISQQGYTFGQLVLHVSDPRYRQGITRYNFFRERGLVQKILDLWVSGGNSDTGRDEVHGWSVGYVASIIKKEAHAITKAGWLQTLRRPINAAFVLGFNMSNIHDRLQESAGVAMCMFEAFAAGQRVAKLTLQRKVKKQTVRCLKY